MPDFSGIDFFKNLRYKPEVIFTTAYSEFAIDGFELNAFDYLLKPVSFEKFTASCNRAKEYIELKTVKIKRDYFFINAAHKFYKIFYDDILYLEGLEGLYPHLSPVFPISHWLFCTTSNTSKICWIKRSSAGYIVPILFR